MKQTNGAIQKTVTIIYGGPAIERMKKVNEKISGKRPFELWDIYIDGNNITARTEEKQIDIFVYSGIDIDPVKKIIESNEMDIHFFAKIKKIQKPQLVCDIHDFSTTDINYFGLMPHVTLVRCPEPIRK